MNRGEISSRIKIKLGFKLGTGLDADINSQIQQAQKELEEEPELPWFLKKAYSGLSTVALTQTVSVPADFLRELDDDQLFVRDTSSNETAVVADQQGFLRQRYPISDDPGTPKGYSIVNGVFYFYPIPDAVYSIQGTYFASDTTLAADGDTNKWSFHLPEILIGKAGYVIASGLRDQMAMQDFAGVYGRAVQKLNEKNTADEAAGSKPVAGGEN
jgi:hypothetical protein